MSLIGSNSNSQLPDNSTGGLFGDVIRATATTAITDSLKFLAKEGFRYLQCRVSSSYSATTQYGRDAFDNIYNWCLSTGVIVSGLKHLRISGSSEYSSERTVTAIAKSGHYFKYINSVLVHVVICEGKASKGNEFTIITVNLYGKPNNHLDCELRKVVDSSIDDSTTKIFDLECPWKYTRKEVRSIDTVVLSQRNRELLMNHLDWWKTSKDSHVKYGLTYKTGILLYGPPGTGKSSLAQAIAGYLNFNMALISIKPNKMDDLRTTISTTPPRTVLLIEDVDRSITIPGLSAKPEPIEVPADIEESMSIDEVLANIEDTEQYLADAPVKAPERAIPGIEHLMNALDGISSPSGVVIIMTTNHIEKIDPAVIRPGRIDLKLLMDRFTFEMACEMGSRFGVDSNTVKSYGEDVWNNPAVLQLRLIRNGL